MIYLIFVLCIIHLIKAIRHLRACKQALLNVTHPLVPCLIIALWEETDFECVCGSLITSLVIITAFICNASPLTASIHVRVSAKRHFSPDMKCDYIVLATLSLHSSEWRQSKSPRHTFLFLSLSFSVFFTIPSCCVVAFILRNQANLLNTTNMSTETIPFMLNFSSQSLWQHITMLWDLSSLLQRRHFEVWG